MPKRRAKDEVEDVELAVQAARLQSATLGGQITLDLATSTASRRRCPKAGFRWRSMIVLYDSRVDRFRPLASG